MEEIVNLLDHYSAKLDTIRAIPEGKVQTPGSIPVKVYLQEAENLYNWCQADREKLTANGLDWQFVNDMPARIDTLREAQSRWSTSGTDDIDVEKRWHEEAPAAHEFRKELVRSLKFAFRDNPTILASIAKMAEGQGHSSVIQSLRDLSVYGLEHGEYLLSKGFDMEKLSKAAIMSQELGSLLAAVNTGRAFNSEYLDLRNRAYTHLMEAVHELKAHAAYVFVHDENRMRGYTSQYSRKKYLKNRNKMKIIKAAGAAQQEQAKE